MHGRPEVFCRGTMEGLNQMNNPMKAHHVRCGTRRQSNLSSLIWILFLLLVPLSGSEPLGRFAWLSDTHVGTASANADLSRAVKDINSLEGIDFTIVSGDIAGTDTDDYLEVAKASLDSLRQPYHSIPGNHDTRWSASGATKFVHLWGADRFSFEWGDCGSSGCTRAR